MQHLSQSLFCAAVIFGSAFSIFAGMPEKDPAFEFEIQFVETLSVNQMSDWLVLQIKQLKAKYSENKHGLKYVDARYGATGKERLRFLETIEVESPYFFRSQFYVAMHTESIEKKYDILHRLLMERRFSTREETSLLVETYLSPSKQHPAYARGVAAAEKQWAKDKGKHSVPGTDKAVEVKNEILKYVHASNPNLFGGKIHHEDINYSAGYRDRIKKLLLKHIAEKPKVAP